MKESYLAECLEKFHNLPEVAQEFIGGFDACLEIKKLEEIYNISLSFAVILVAIDELTLADLPEYLQLKFKLDLARGEEVANILDEKIFTPVLDLIENGDEDELKIVPQRLSDKSLSERKELILDIFENQILKHLSADDDYLKDLNVAIFLTLNEDENLEDKIESLLYVNQEKITNHQIILDGHPASPSIANWLKDFIKQYGSDLFNEVTLAEYLTQSLNIRQLKPEEKDLIRKLLKLYRNLVFFPESMDGILMDDWEIFPVNKKNPDSLSITKEKISEETESIISTKQKTILDLQKSLTKYPSSSLEYKAISQEINRLNR
jgi:hypothetical protein